MTTTEQKRRSRGHSTAEERELARTARRSERRTAHYVDRMRAAGSPRQRLSEACAFLRAVADDLPDEEVQELAVKVTAMADERNKA